MITTIELEISFKEFYRRCIQKYRIGDKEHYIQAIETKDRHCYNPYISTERDIQVKLGGIIDDYLIENKLPYSLNSEMNIYGLNNKVDRADLSIHKIESETLYTSRDKYIENLVCAIEIKYANAKSPNFDFLNGSVNKDLNKLSRLGEKVEKVFVFIDEADRTLEDNLNNLIEVCRTDGITLFTNNKYINSHNEFAYGKQFLLAI
jgi:hypothetical protein